MEDKGSENQAAERQGQAARAAWKNVDARKTAMAAPDSFCQ
jgi:hypothetical protein